MIKMISFFSIVTILLSSTKITLARNISSTNTTATSNSNQFTNIRPSFFGYYFEPCNCFKHTTKNFSEYFSKNTGTQSTCSDEADLFGTGQKVISYSLFDPKIKKEGNINDFLDDFTEGIWPNLSQIRRFYSDWFVRIYTNFNLTREYCRVACLDNVFWCDIRTSIVPDMEITNGRVWRFLPLGDSTVDIFVSRDIDSYIVEREKEIVDDWLENNPDKGFHLARDSGSHNFREMLAGIWGGRNDVLGFDFARSVRDRILLRAKNNFKQSTDEVLLKEIIFRQYQDKILQHDSYLCTRFNGSIPFPKQRPNPRVRIAQSIRNMARYVSKACPVKCRPSYGKNWTYC